MDVLRESVVNYFYDPIGLHRNGIKWIRCNMRCPLIRYHSTLGWAERSRHGDWYATRHGRDTVKARSR